MALLGNNARLGKNPLRFMAVTTTVALGGHMHAERRLWNQDGRNRNWYASESEISSLSAIPAGARHPVAWLMAPTAGGLASHKETTFSLSQAGTAVLGKPASGTSTITLTTTATGGLIVSGSGTATFSVTATGTVLSIASGQGSAAITISAAAAIGAEAGMSGSATIVISGSAGSYAIGYLAGLSTNETEFSANALAQAVWSALAADYVEAGTMGEVVNEKLLTLIKFLALK